MDHQIKIFYNDKSTRVIHIQDVFFLDRDKQEIHPDIIKSKSLSIADSFRGRYHKVVVIRDGKVVSLYKEFITIPVKEEYKLSNNKKKFMVRVRRRFKHMKTKATIYTLRTIRSLKI
jgi:hypothetical protein